jgi:hypothetical protein
MKYAKTPNQLMVLSVALASAAALLGFTSESQAASPYSLVRAFINPDQMKVVATFSDNESIQQVLQTRNKSVSRDKDQVSDETIHWIQVWGWKTENVQPSLSKILSETLSGRSGFVVRPMLVETSDQNLVDLPGYYYQYVGY